MADRTAVLFLTHVWNPIVHLRFWRLRSEIGERADVYVLRQGSAAMLRSFTPPPELGRWTFVFDPERLPRFLGYPFYEPPGIVPGSTHYPVMAFARCKPEYDRFLVVEFDVEFSGDWGALFDEIARPGLDFAAMHFRPYEPEWQFWAPVRPAEGDREWYADEANRRRSFNPIYFVSRRALELVEQAHRDGWRAHYEILLATILGHHGCALLDIGAATGLCLGHEQDPLPDTPVAELATVRWRPPVTVEEFHERSTGRTLFHPVKGTWFYNGSQVVRFRFNRIDRDEPAA